MFKKVLLDLGSSVDMHLLAQAVEFCDRVGAKLTALSVFEEPSQPVSSYFSSQHKDLRKIVLDSYEAAVDEGIAKHGINADGFEREVRWGKDFLETIRLVNEGNFDLVISASQEIDGPPDSTAMHLMRKCPCPVWIHRGNLWKGAIRILVAVNTSDTSDENRNLNKKILQYATHLNESLRGHLHIVTCWSGYMESVLASPRFSDKERAEYMDFEQKRTQDELKLLANSLNLESTVRAKIMHGNPAVEIPEYAASQKMDLVIMGSVARTGIPGLLVGNTAEKIVSNLENSIIAIKPEGFDSPVK